MLTGVPLIGIRSNNTLNILSIVVIELLELTNKKPISEL